jgi:hypothetical protein
MEGKKEGCLHKEPAGSNQAPKKIADQVRGTVLDSDKTG